MLRCSDGSYYVGSTRNLEIRLAQHQFGEGGDYTSRRRPVELVWHSEFERIDEAYSWERRIHGWSRAKKELLTAGKYDELQGWSKRQRDAKRAASDPRSHSGSSPGS
ncbi:GIY-YIG nuclease family protein [Microbacterium sp. OR21]|uniref:GIY-YIG nuclease family protein n=1 Tax=Microbacterium sp. OR21 TaxID=3095346 RepID=UPI0039B6B6C4